MRIVVRVVPLVYPCAGCSSSASAAARAAAGMLDRRGLGETRSLPGAAADAGPELSRAKSRFPVFAIDGCREACAWRWLVHHGVTPQRHFVLTDLGVAEHPGGNFDPAEVDRVIERIAADW